MVWRVGGFLPFLFLFPWAALGFSLHTPFVLSGSLRVPSLYVLIYSLLFTHQK